MKPLLFFIAVLLLLLTTAVRVIESYAEETAVIAGWNILGFQPIPAERVPRIAKVIRKINPDLIVLTEVQPNAVVADIVQELGADYQPPVILPQKATVIQNIAFVFKTGVQVTDAQLLAGTDLAEEERSRQALMAKVQIGSFDFVLIGVHLKSGRATADRNKRTRQCQALNTFISQATTGSEKDVLVVGDYNMIPRQGQQRNDEINFITLSPANFLRFISSDFLQGKASHLDGCNPIRGNLLDGFAISRQFTTEYTGASTKLVPFGKLGHTCASFLSQVSDHRPVVSTFHVSTDDD